MHLVRTPIRKRTGEIMNLYFLRHGEAFGNLEHRYFGKEESSLTMSGIKQCERCKKLLEDITFDRVYISERKRARETADIIFEKRTNNFIVDARINERDFGIFDGKTYEEICKSFSAEEKAWGEDWVNYVIPEGESFKNFYDRISSFMDTMKKLDDKNVLIITHGGVIRAVYTYIMDGNYNVFWKFSSQNGDLSLIKYEYGNLFIDSIIHTR